MATSSPAVAQPLSSAPKRVVAKVHATDRVLPMLVSVWLTVLVLSVYRAPDLREVAGENAWLRQQPAVLAALDELVAFAERTGATANRQHWSSLVGELESPRPVMRRKIPPPPPPADPVVAADDAPFELPRYDGPRPPLDELGPPRARRVLLVGASSIQFYLGAEIERRLEEHRDVVVQRLGKLGTGLARPDEFDWPKKIDELLASFQPDVVIAQLGGNDAQSLKTAEGKYVHFGTRAWDREYGRRLEDVIARIRKAGAQVVMLGMPVMRSSRFSKRLTRVNLLTEEASRSAGAIYISTWDIAADPFGKYQPTVSYRGQTGLSRLADGIHYSRLGAQYVSERIAWRLQRHFRLTATDGALAHAIRLGFDSQMLGRKVSYLAYVPQELRDGETLPVLYLLHGAGGSYVDWSDHAHEALQRLAQQHRLMIVTPEGLTDSWYLESARLSGGRAETYFMWELIPHVQRHLPHDGRQSIAGLSMGGHGALSLALKYPGTFAAASSMSGALDLSQATNRDALISRLGPYEENTSLWHRHSVAHLLEAHPKRARTLPTLVTIARGDRWLETNRKVQDALTKIGGLHEYEESPGEHDWAYWTSVLPRHVAWHASLVGPAPVAEPSPTGQGRAPAALRSP